MKLQTQIPLKKTDNKIDYSSRLLLMGSCFVRNIGQKLEYYKFPCFTNPLGILFHPKAIETLVLRAIGNKTYSEADIFFLNERWHCFDAHSDLSDTSKRNLLLKLNNGLEETHQQLRNSTHIVITLGTAWVYRFRGTGKIVANCHKVPQKEFSKELLSVDQIVDSLENSIKSIQSVNKNIQFVFTVSPIRHLKDGFVENQRSKSHLITAIHQLVEASPLGDRGHYFPSYELMMDELRDYRFYEADMVHPNQLAIDYVWEKFKYVWIDESAYPVMEKVGEVQKGLQHRPLNPDSEQHKKFLRSLGDKIVYLEREYPFMAFNV